MHVLMWRNTETTQNEAIDSEILRVSIKNHIHLLRFDVSMGQSSNPRPQILMMSESPLFDGKHIETHHGCL